MSALSASMDRWKFTLRVFATGAHPVKGNLIDVGRIAGSVDLDVLAAGFHQLLNHLSLNGNDIVDEVIQVFVDAL